jgi:hypothetical protein
MVKRGVFLNKGQRLRGQPLKCFICKSDILIGKNFIQYGGLGKVYCSIACFRKKHFKLHNIIKKFESLISSGEFESLTTETENKGFYSSPQWLRLRYKALLIHGAKCMVCGRANKDGIIMHVDHIKPRCRYPELQLELSNLQVLCSDCNMGKSG